MSRFGAASFRARSCALSGSPVHAHALSPAAAVDAMKTNEWLVANNNVTGYYRVNYDQDNWERLLQTLSSSHQVRRRARTPDAGRRPRAAG